MDWESEIVSEEGSAREVLHWIDYEDKVRKDINDIDVKVTMN